MKKELSQIKHARSAKEFRNIDLAEDEYVVLHIQRSKLGIMIIWFVAAFLAIVLTAAVILLTNTAAIENSYFTINSSSKGYLVLGVIALYFLLFFCAWAGQSIYKSNHLYITNRRAIQTVRNSLFSNSTNIIELAKIEDVSYRQVSIWDHIFQVGTLRMATVGDETTYTFPFLDTPDDEVDQISKLVQSSRQAPKK
jgi:hypothetical protein